MASKHKSAGPPDSPRTAARRSPAGGHPPLPSSPPLSAAFAIRHGSWPWRKAIGAPIATALAMGLGLSLGHFSWGAWAFMGAFTSMYVVPLPYGPRARRLLLVGLGLAAAMAVGSLASVSWAAMAVGLALVAGAGTFVTGAFDVPLPAGFMFVLIACIAAALPVHPALTPIRVGFALVGAALAWIVGMAGWGWHPRQPERQAVAAAWGSLAAYAGRAGGRGGFSAEAQAGRAVAAAEAAVAPLLRLPHRGPDATRLVLLAHQARRLFEALTISAAALEDHVMARLGHVAQALDRAEPVRFAAPARASRRSAAERAVAAAERILAFRGSWPALVPTLGWPEPAAWDRMRVAAGPTSLVRVDAMRIAIAVGAGTALAGLLGEAHPYWVPLTIAAVLQGQSQIGMAQRGIQRVAGTAVGLGLAGALLLWHPVPWATVGAMVVLQFLLLLLIVTNYGLSVVFITALALVIIVTEVHVPIWPLLWARFADTLGGVALALLALRWLWPRDASARLPAAMADVVERAGALWAARLRGAQADASAAGALGVAVATLHALSTDAAAEWRRWPGLEGLWPAIVGAERLGWVVRATACPAGADEAPWGEAFASLAAAAREGRAPAPLPLARPGPAPAVREALCALGASLSRPVHVP